MSIPVKDKGSEVQPSGRHSPEGIRPDLSLRMVLVGKTGAGKGSSGNTILGEQVFRASKSGSSITKECGKETGEVAGRKITLVDTPGLFDTDLSETELKQRISKCINMTAPGPHAIVLVIQLGPFTKEEGLAVEKIRAIFGEEADKYTIILFTHGDDLNSTIEEYLSEANTELRDLITRCGERYHVFNNKEIQDRLQVLEFLEKVDSLVSANEDKYYTNKIYQDVESTLRTQEEKLRKSYEKKLQEKERELESKFQEEKRKLQEKIEALRESNEEKERKIRELQHLDLLNKTRLIEYKRYYEARLKAVRQEAEQTRVSEEVLKQIMSKLENFSI
ncbi:GTPase IMAP family member 7 [Salminus brasiliensis]|uniref:GTPase IMAP family member 7 n=1 Tax=Salminus brasiliensis TaxID=930266 RepID=UPI003B8399D1